MSIKRSQFTAFFFTFLLFVLVASFLFEIPDSLPTPKMPDFSSWFSKTSTPPIKNNNKVYSSGKEGKVIDKLNGVKIYYNGKVSKVSGRNVTSDGYNLGLKYQCVEFVKRYYYEYYNHKMPNSYGNAKDFVNPNVYNGNLNKDRGLIQFKNGGNDSPQIGDLIVFGATPYNRFGHVAIVSNFKTNKIQIAQQNPGANNPSREWIPLSKGDGKFFLNHQYIIGWLRMP